MDTGRGRGRGRGRPGGRFNGRHDHGQGGRWHGNAGGCHGWNNGFGLNAGPSGGNFNPSLGFQPQFGSLGQSVAGQGFFGAAPSGPLASAPVAFPVLPGAGAVLPAASVAAGIPPFPVAGGDVAPGGPAVTIPAAGLQAGGHVAGGLVDGKGAVVGPTGGTKAAAKLGSGGVMASGGMQAVGASRVGVRQLILLVLPVLPLLLYWVVLILLVLIHNREFVLLMQTKVKQRLTTKVRANLIVIDVIQKAIQCRSVLLSIIVRSVKVRIILLLVVQYLDLLLNLLPSYVVMLWMVWVSFIFLFELDRELNLSQRRL